jgi:hypothetical protein
LLWIDDGDQGKSLEPWHGSGPGMWYLDSHEDEQEGGHGKGDGMGGSFLRARQFKFNPNLNPMPAGHAAESVNNISVYL